MASDQDNLLTQYSCAPLDVDELLQMYEANPENLNVLDCLAFKFYTSDDLDRSLEFYQKIVKMDDKNESAHYYIGNILYRKKRVMAAIMQWKKVVSLDPESKLAQKAQERIDQAMNQIRDM